MSRKVDYALLVLSYLDGHPEGSCARRAAEHFGLSRGFVANILKELCQKRFVTSHRGVKGGYVLQRPASAINLAEIMEALDDPFRLAECCGQAGPNEGCCLEEVCSVKGAIAEVHERLRQVLKKVTLADLLRPGLRCRTVELGLEPLRAGRN